MGMRDIFDAKKACLDRILAQVGRSHHILVDTVIHKAIIRVDEEGTVAAAVTVVMTRAIEPTLKFDRPFLFMLRAGPSILFMGQFTGDRAPTFNDPNDWNVKPVQAAGIQNLMKKN
jgi:serpin B